MTDCDLDTMNEKAIGRVSNRRQETNQIDGETCGVCKGAGVLPNTETEDLWGLPCPRGCALDRSRFVNRADLSQIGDAT